MRAAVLCLGRLWCDLLFTGLPRLPTPGSEVFAEDVAIAPGGGAFITASVLAAGGRRAYLLSRLGLDPLSAALEPSLRASGVDLAFLERAVDAGPQPTVALIQGAERAFLSRRAGSSKPALWRAALSAPDVRHLHIAEAATLFDMPDLIETAKSQGLTLSLDPSWDDALLFRPDFLERCAGIDVFLPNDAEFEAVTGGQTWASGLDLLARHFPLTVLKRGAEGAIAARGAERLSIPAPPCLLRDSTGAGDSFNAGLLDGWLAGTQLSEAVAMGVTAGGAAVGRIGGAPAVKDIAAREI